MTRVMKRELSEEQLTEYRTLHVTASTLIPFLEQRQSVAYQKLLGEFRNSKTADLALVAECNAYTSIIEEVNSKISNYERLTKEKP